MIPDERLTAPAVREWHNHGAGPTEQWARHLRSGTQDEQFARLLWREGWTCREIADYLGAAVSWVRAATVGSRS